MHSFHLQGSMYTVTCYIALPEPPRYVYSKNEDEWEDFTTTYATLVYAIVARFWLF